MGDVTFEKMSAFKGDLVPIGLPVDNSVVYLLDKKLNPVPSGQIGEIYCSGLNLASGYVNNRDADRFIANPHTVEPQYALLYKTGDYGKIVDGTLVYEGRTDSQVRITEQQQQKIHRNKNICQNQQSIQSNQMKKVGVKILNVAMETVISNFGHRFMFIISIDNQNLK